MRLWLLEEDLNVSARNDPLLGDFLESALTGKEITLQCRVSHTVLLLDLSTGEESFVSKRGEGLSGLAPGLCLTIEARMKPCTQLLHLLRKAVGL